MTTYKSCSSVLSVDDEAFCSFLQENHHPMSYEDLTILLPETILSSLDAAEPITQRCCNLQLITRTRITQVSTSRKNFIPVYGSIDILINLLLIYFLSVTKLKVPLMCILFINIAHHAVSLNIVFRFYATTQNAL